MKASELIGVMNAIISRHGDVEVLTACSDETDYKNVLFVSMGKDAAGKVAAVVINNWASFDGDNEEWEPVELDQLNLPQVQVGPVLTRAQNTHVASHCPPGW